ncbi:MAG: 4Fe-4S dicluster domain-containing protein [Candidatus Goldbacteria bacterium]|nr:4Fe-4S dicluster domain-containing protein [Candidatus Goldiibacteriota bacterium]
MKKGRIIIDEERCKGCLICVHQCAKKEIQISDKINKSGYNVVEFKNSGQCNACALCAIVCPDVAIEVIEIIEEKEQKK